MKKNILVITSSIDSTVDYIIKKYINVANFFRIDTDSFSQYDFYLGNIENGWIIKDKRTNTAISKNQVYSIYYRKPMLPDLSEYDKKYHSMIEKDILSIINGIADDFPRLTLTKPTILRKTENKTFQLLFGTSQMSGNIPESFNR